MDLIILEKFETNSISFIYLFIFLLRLLIKTTKYYFGLALIQKIANKEKNNLNKLFFLIKVFFE